ncbi:hypothetical protein ACFQ3Z_41560 [Streptomyces nogalater]
MTAERAEGVVRAVVVYDGRLLLVPEKDGWGLPSGTPQPAETPRPPPRGSSTRSPATWSTAPSRWNNGTPAAVRPSCAGC